MEENFSTKLTVIVILFFGQSSFSFAQNLVMNGSFEEYSKCPYADNQLKFCKNWSKAVGGSTPEYFNSCSEGMQKIVNYSVSVPKNVEGEQEAKDGRAYAGAAFYAMHNFYFREYLQGKLKDKLEEGKRYTFSFFISQAEKSYVSTNVISVCFSVNNSLVLAKPPHPLLRCLGKTTIRDIDFKNTKDWIEVKGSYVALGGESYITIGVFDGDLKEREFKELGRIFKAKLDDDDSGYYYIDNVSVIKSDTLRYSHH
jgi:hypothetical protein